MSTKTSLSTFIHLHHLHSERAVTAVVVVWLVADLRPVPALLGPPKVLFVAFYSCLFRLLFFVPCHPPPSFCLQERWAGSWELLQSQRQCVCGVKSLQVARTAGQKQPSEALWTLCPNLPQQTPTLASPSSTLLPGSF